MKTLVPVVFLTTMFVAGVATAQYYRDGGYSTYHHASTAEEGMLRGMGDLTRSAGEANLRNSEAANNYEDARSKDLDNRLKATDTYFQMRAANKQYRDSERSPRSTTEQLFRRAREAAPKSLSPTELDPFTGKVDWPLALRGQAFGAERSIVDDVFANRYSSSGVTTADAYQAVNDALASMENTLKANIRDYPSGDYMKAKNFLHSLSYAASGGAPS